MKISAENLTLEIKPGDKITYQDNGSISAPIITYTAAHGNTEQFEKQGVSSHSAELSYKEFVRVMTHCLFHTKKDPLKKLITYTHRKDKK